MGVPIIFSGFPIIFRQNHIRDIYIYTYMYIYKYPARQFSIAPHGPIHPLLTLFAPWSETAPIQLSHGSVCLSWFCRCDSNENFFQRTMIPMSSNVTLPLCNIWKKHAATEYHDLDAWILYCMLYHWNLWILVDFALPGWPWIDLG